MLSYCAPNIVSNTSKTLALGFAVQNCLFKRKFMAMHSLELWLHSDVPDLIRHVLIGEPFTYFNMNSVYHVMYLFSV